MGQRAVVDPQLRVRGVVGRRRAIDVSVIPVISGGNTTAPTVENGADMIMAS